jgi:hypothetical protein
MARKINWIKSHWIILTIVIFVLSLSILKATRTVTAQVEGGNLPAPFASQDIGGVKLPGSASYDASTGKFTIKASGSDIWDKNDEFHYVYQQVSGDVQIIAKAESLTETNEWAKLGIMIRESLTPNSRHALTGITPLNGLAFQFREQVGGDTKNASGSKVKTPQWLKLTREENILKGYSSADGNNWTLIGTANVDMPTNVYIGLILTSHNNDALNTGEISNVSISSLPPPEKLIVKGMEMSDATKLYEIVPGVGAVPQANVRVKNRHSYDVNGQIKGILRARGKEKVWEGNVGFQAAVNEEKVVAVPTAALTNADLYEFEIQVIDQDGTVSAKNKFNIGIVRPAAKGLKPNSMFGLGLRSEGNQEVHKKIAEKLGVKWQRGFNRFSPDMVSPAPGQFWGKNGYENDINVQNARKEILDWHKHGVSVVGLLAYNMSWNIMPGPNGEPLQIWQNRPKDLVAQADMNYHAIAALQDLVNVWEVWNEPWIHSWTWATGEAQDYRDLLKLTWDRVKPAYPNIDLIGGGSVPYHRDIVYAKGSKDIGYMDGSVNHGYGPPEPGFVGGAKLQKKMDELWSKGKGRAGMWQTEFGTAEYYFPELPYEERFYQVARTLAPLHLKQMLGAEDTPIRFFWFTLSYDAGFSGGEYNIYDVGTRSPRPAAIAYAAMTHFLEDSKLVGALYPEAKSTWLYLFKRNDGKSVVALYSDKEYQGTVSLSRASGIKVYDYLGKEISNGSKSNLTIKLNPWETNYFVSDRSIDELKSLFGQAKYDFTSPLIVSPLSFSEPISQHSKIDVQVENASPNTISARLTITAPKDWELVNSSTPFVLWPGQKQIISFPAKKTALSRANRYLVSYQLDFYNNGVKTNTQQKGQQTIQVAYAPYQSVTIDGNLEDWKSIPAVTMQSSANKNYVEAALNPDKVDEILNKRSLDNVIYKLKTAWDDNHFYVSAEIPDNEQRNSALFSKDPYNFPFWADSIQLAFDVIKDNPDDLLKGDPFYEKAMASDMDYLFIGSLAEGGIPQLYRQTAPGTNYQTYYPTNADLVPPLGAMKVTAEGGEEGKMKVSRDEASKLTTYEIAVSWKALPDLQKEVMKLRKDQRTSTNFAFAVTDTNRGTSYWTKEAGQLQSGGYNFAPFWGTAKSNGGRVITRWGISKAEPVKIDCSKKAKIPTNVKAVAGHKQMSLTWSEDFCDTSYEVYRDGVKVAGVVAASYVDTGLVNDKQYCYTVKAINGVGASEESSKVCATPRTPNEPDLVVTDVSWIPENPTPGSPVVFSAVIKNQGKKATASGVAHNVTFYVGGQKVSWSDTSTESLAVGASRTIKASGGPDSTNAWTSTAGVHGVEAVVDEDKKIVEIEEDNNRYSEVLLIGKTPAAVPVPGKIEAEEFVNNKGIEIRNSGAASGGKYAISYEVGDWSEYYVKVPTLGTYKIDMKVACANAGTAFELKNGHILLGKVEVGNTGGWDVWKTVSLTTTLTAGEQLLRLVSAGSANYPDIDYLEITLVSTPTPTPAPVISYKIGLAKNWNLVSIPVQPENTDVGEVLKGIEGKYMAVHAWNGKEYESYYPGSASSTLKRMEAGRGYWIYMKEKADLEIEGKEARSLSIELKKDWNLVGYNSIEGMDTETALGPIGNKVLVVYGYSASNNSYEVAGKLEGGRGYWLLCTEDNIAWTLPAK